MIVMHPKLVLGKPTARRQLRFEPSSTFVVALSVILIPDFLAIFKHRYYCNSPFLYNIILSGILCPEALIYPNNQLVSFASSISASSLFSIVKTMVLLIFFSNSSGFYKQDMCSFLCLMT